MKTGVWPLKEYENCVVTHSKITRERLTVEDYLKKQGRFAHLFQPQRNETLIAEIQARVDAYWAEASI